MTEPQTSKKTRAVTHEHDTQDNDSHLTYEQARDELISVVNRLESGGESLAESMELFKRGEYLAQLCERHLSEARAVLQANQD